MAAAAIMRTGRLATPGTDGSNLRTTTLSRRSRHGSPRLARVSTTMRSMSGRAASRWTSVEK